MAIKVTHKKKHHKKSDAEDEEVDVAPLKANKTSYFCVEIMDGRSLLIVFQKGQTSMIKIQPMSFLLQFQRRGTCHY